MLRGQEIDYTGGDHRDYYLNMRKSRVEMSKSQISVKLFGSDDGKSVPKNPKRSKRTNRYPTSIADELDLGRSSISRHSKLNKNSKSTHNLPQPKQKQKQNVFAHKNSRAATEYNDPEAEDPECPYCVESTRHKSVIDSYSKKIVEFAGQNAHRDRQREHNTARKIVFSPTAHAPAETDNHKYRHRQMGHNRDPYLEDRKS